MDRTVERLGVLLREVVVADPLAVLEAVGRVEALIEREAPAAGVEARGQGATWVEIGAAVGSTRAGGISEVRASSAARGRRGQTPADRPVVGVWSAWLAAADAALTVGRAGPGSTRRPAGEPCHYVAPSRVLTVGRDAADGP
ncbi:hypothetical protein ACIF70_38030 [Actinacidiphila glaucinigra]|uniref:hypothetical protein n=1 Tax=Actinacidiphila glaucinigra TaxID=235986 RepID=UPI0037CBDDDF